MTRMRWFMMRMTRVCAFLWLLGHVPPARADTSCGAPPFTPVALAASRKWLAAASIRDGDREDQLVVMRSSDGGASWQKLPSPHSLATWPTCCSENAAKQMVGVRLSVGDDGSVEVSGGDDNCGFAETGWRYRWSGGRWQEPEKTTAGLAGLFAVEHETNGQGRPRQDPAPGRRR
jgi:hypothetical protein